MALGLCLAQSRRVAFHTQQARSRPSVAYDLQPPSQWYDRAVSRRAGGEAGEAETLRAYLREIGKCPRLTPEEERELGLRIQRDHDELALRRLVESNLRFVVAYAKRYRGLGVPFLDVIHEGNLGLIEAAKRFDPGRGVKFITYAVWWIRQAIMHALSDQARAFSLPARLSPVAARFGRQVAALTAQLDHVPSVEEIADDLEISVGEADALMHIGHGDVSLSDPVGSDSEDEPRELADVLAQKTVPPAETSMIRRAFASELRAALGELDPKEREVVALRFGLGGGEPLTLQQIGDRLGLSRERVRQIEARAKEKLRRSRKVGELRSYLN